MNLFNNTGFSTIMHILFRDFLMIYLLGFCFPLIYVKINELEGVQVLGITKRKLGLSLVLNLVFAAALLSMFILKNSVPIIFTYKSFFAISYILVAGIFEMVCIYGFVRFYLEKAFGILPAIVLTAVFYSLHHAGFQPEFLKLFFVGIMYCSIFYITHNIFVIFPFFWGVGAIWDVLIDSTAGQSLQNITTLFVSIGLLLGMLVFVLIINGPLKKVVGVRSWKSKNG